MFKVFNMSLTGTRHLAMNRGCQDANCIRVLANGWIVAAVADGLGSKKCSDVGASLAVHTVVNYIAEHCPETWEPGKLYAILRASYNEALESIKCRAKEECEFLDSYDTTLTTCIYDGNRVVFAHVGDGGILTMRADGKYSILTQRQRGERFNFTTPLRSGTGNWSFGMAMEEVQGLLLMTDGVLDVACPWEYGKPQTIDTNFVGEFLNREMLKTGNLDTWEHMRERVENFLMSDECAKITDDKTVVGIMNIILCNDNRIYDKDE